VFDAVVRCIMANLANYVSVVPCNEFAPFSLLIRIVSLGPLTSMICLDLYKILFYFKFYILYA